MDEKWINEVMIFEKDTRKVLGLFGKLLEKINNKLVYEAVVGVHGTVSIEDIMETILALDRVKFVRKEN